jgi:hypothetical protein
MGVVDVEREVGLLTEARPGTRTRRPAKVKPNTYFKKVQAQLENFHDKMSILMQKRFDMYPILASEEDTTDEDFAAGEEILKEIETLTERITTFLTEHTGSVHTELNTCIESIQNAKEAVEEETA